MKKRFSIITVTADDGEQQVFSGSEVDLKDGHFYSKKTWIKSLKKHGYGVKEDEIS